MRNRRRNGLAFIVSLVGHFAIMTGGSFSVQCVPNIELPELDFELAEVELIDPNLLQGEQSQPDPKPPVAEPVAPPPPPPTPEDPKAAEEKPPPEKEEEKPKPKKKKFAAKGSKADRLAPPQSTWSILFIPKRVRRLPFRQTVLDIMAPLPDFE
ncbi:MAG: hypothetical protein K0V04_29795, partial [Deltaproteobacteria bacterium]|nr:hypothetical protein [Deltaproteobacteria bacterium]